MPYPVKRFLKVNENMVWILLVFKIFAQMILRLNIYSVVLLPVLKPACSSAMISSACGFSLLSSTFSITLLGWLIRLIVHSRVSQILLHMIVRVEIMASPPLFINSAGMLSSPGDFPLSDISLLLPLPLLGWGICRRWCRRDHLVLLCRHCSHDCISQGSIL